MFKSNLVQRVLSAIVLIPVLIWIIFCGPELLFRITIIAVFAGALWETLNMFRARVGSPNFIKEHDFLRLDIEQTKKVVLHFILYFLLYGTIIFSETVLTGAIEEIGNRYLMATLVVLFLSSIPIVSMKKLHLELRAELLVFSIFSWIYVSMIGSLILLRISSYDALVDGRRLIAFVLCITWLTDTGAYAVGRLIGKHKLAPTISPGKTREGAIGGICFALVGTIVLNHFYFLGFGTNTLIGLSIAGSFAAQIGDLIESVIKRYCGVKDSGKLIPGHGGLLDRIDSILFVGAVVYAATQLIYW